MATPSKKRFNTTSPEIAVMPGKPHLHSLAKPEADLVLLVDAQGSVTYASPPILPLLGYSPEVIIGAHLCELVHPDDAATLQHVLAELADAPGKSLKETYRLRAQDDAVHLAEGTVTNLLQVPGVGAVVAHFHPLPQQKLPPRSKQKKIRDSEHFVQFYESDAFLLDSVQGFIETGLNTEEVCIVVATQAHHAQLEAQLQASGLDLDAARTQGMYLSLNANEALEQFMVGRLPNQARFNALMGTMIARAAKNQRHVRVFGEMVALLWTAGNQAAAIRLEELWNNLPSTTPPFSLFCAYAMPDFAGEENEESFGQICHQHARVIPTESYTALPRGDERLRAISILQQKANTLQDEIKERKAAEQRTFEALTALLALAHSLAWTQQDAEPPTMRTFAPQLAQLARQALGCEGVALIACDENSETLETLAIAGTPSHQTHHWEGARLEEALPPEAITTLQAGASLALNTTPTAFHATSLKQRGELLAPMRLAERLVGFLSYTHGPGAHTSGSQERHLAEAVAQLAAFVLEREHWLTERTATQTQLLALEETARQMEAFVSIVSHELRTPITALKTSIQLARRRIDQELDGKAVAEEKRGGTPAALLERTEAQVRRLTRLIDDLVDLARIRSGKLELRMKWCDLGEVVSELVESEHMVHPNRLIYFEPPSEPLLVTGDPDRLGQVALNYLTNALKYAPPDRPITVRVEQKEACVQVSVQDQGPGIQPEEQALIWDVFHRVPGIAVQSGSGIGLGLGLHISKTMIERQGGQVGVESAAGQGSTFWFSLPLASSEPSSQENLTMYLDL